jgi:hypothetical protein
MSFAVREDASVVMSEVFPTAGPIALHAGLTGKIKVGEEITGSVASTVRVYG